VVEPELEYIPFDCTAYCPCVSCSGEYGCMTSTGTIATAGRTIAVDPTVIPYGAEVIIEGKNYIAEDCGGAIKGNRIDIFFNTHEEARAFGRKTLNVAVIG
jgi:3D (Asp-Asp-Asp) domain-containing protein